MDFIQIVLNIVLLLLEERTNRIKLLYNYILGINYQIELVQYWKFLFSVRQTKGKIFLHVFQSVDLQCTLWSFILQNSTGGVTSETNQGKETTATKHQGQTERGTGK